MHILLTNDDGIDAPGLASLESIVSQFATVSVVAPDRAYSGCSHQVTNDQAIHVEMVGERRYRVAGTPADCTRVGLAEIAPLVDWVFSGVNFGGNLGVDLWMSGTVAAIREAAWLGKPGIAFSQYVQRGRQRDWDKTAAMTERVVHELLKQELAPGRFWNVNFPDVDTPAAEVPIVIAQPEPKHFHVNFLKDAGAYHYQGDYRSRPRTDGSDVEVCFGGSIAVSQVSSI